MSNKEFMPYTWYFSVGHRLAREVELLHRYSNVRREEETQEK